MPGRRTNTKEQKRKYRKLTDAEILELLRRGDIWCFGDQVYTRRGVKQDETCHGGYLHVRIYHENKRKSIAKHKLIWMAANGVVVPKGCQIHHMEGKKCNLARYLDLMTNEAHEDLHIEGEVDYQASWEEF